MWSEISHSRPTPAANDSRDLSSWVDCGRETLAGEIHNSLVSVKKKLGHGEKITDMTSADQAARALEHGRNLVVFPCQSLVSLLLPLFEKDCDFHSPKQLHCTLLSSSEVGVVD